MLNNFEPRFLVASLRINFFIMKEKTPVALNIILALGTIGILIMLLALFSDVFGEMVDFFAIGGAILVLPCVGIFVLAALLERGK